MNNLIIGGINKSIGDKKFHLHNMEELFQILEKDDLNSVEKYYLKALYTDIPSFILKEKLLKNLDKYKTKLFLEKMKKLGFYNEDF